MKVTLKSGKIWDFTYQELSTPYRVKGLIHTTRKSIYRLFCDVNEEQEFDIWIGKLDMSVNHNFWFTVEKQLRAKSIEFLRGYVVFNTKND